MFRYQTIILALLPFLSCGFQTSMQTRKVSKTKCFAENAVDRRQLIQSIAAGTALSPLFQKREASAAPPIAIIAEELGYFPVTNKAGETVYVPAKVRRKSSEQSIKLAQYLKSIGAVMYGAYWCPHCSHQKELFGSEAWQTVPYIECSTNGFYYNAQKVAEAKNNIEGFPTWHFPNNKKGKDWVSGEMPLERIVSLSGYKGGFDVTLEGPEVKPSSGSCA